jgi:hypothetical protein
MNKTLAKKVPASIRWLFENRPLLAHEDVSAYHSLLSQAIDEFRPGGLVDWLLLKDIVDDAWEALRWRRLKAPLLDIERRRAMDAALRRIMPGNQDKEIAEIAERWTSELRYRFAAENALERHGQTLNCVEAQAFKQCAKFLEQMDVIMDNAVRRRDRGIRALERRRQDGLNAASPVIVDVPLKKVEPVAKLADG